MRWKRSLSDPFCEGSWPVGVLAWAASSVPVILGMFKVTRLTGGSSRLIVAYRSELAALNVQR